MEAQFHNDYRDTITAFNDIAPSQKELFNESNLPVTHSIAPHEEVYDLIREFIRQLNRDVKYNVTDYHNSNTGWDEPIPDKKGKSGWEKQQNELGLPSSLYPDPAKRAKLKLIKIDNVEKQSTEFETKYACTIIMQKVNVGDQVIVKVTFVRDNINIDDEREFFRDLDDAGSIGTNYGRNYDKNRGTGRCTGRSTGRGRNRLHKNPTSNIVIEQIFIVGFLTDEGVNEGSKKEDFYHFKGLETNDIIDNKKIMRELIKKYKKKASEDLEFAASLDEDGRLFHNELRDVSSYDAFKCTRSIYDDLNGKPIVYE
jgi:hypothetical protein